MQYFFKLFLSNTIIILAITSSLAEEEQVSLEEVFNDNADYFYCSNYQESSDSCIASGQGKIEGKTLTLVQTMLLIPQPPLKAITTTTSELVEKSACAQSTNTKVELVGEADDTTKNMLKEALAQGVANAGTICMNLYQNDDGTYLNRPTNADGGSLGQMPEMTIQFFEKEKPLRIQGL